MMLGQLVTHMQKNEVRLYLTLYMKMNSKCSKDLSLRPTTIKILKDFGLGLGSSFLDRTPKTQATKEK